MSLDVRLLCATEARLGLPLKFPYTKVFALLAYLLLEPGRQRREVLTDLLWPQQDEDTARTNLRNAAHALRKLLGPERLGSDRLHVWFIPRAGDSVDAVQLQGVAASAFTGADAEHVFEQVSGYSGELMPGFIVPDAPAYMEWLDLKRLAFHQKLLVICEQLMDFFGAAGNSARQIELAQTQTRIDPWNESFHLRLLRLLAEAGRIPTALAHFDFMRGLFLRELDIAPGQEVRDLIGRLNASAHPLTQLQTRAEPVQVVARLRPMTLLFVEIRSLATQDVHKLAALMRARQFVSAEVSRYGAHACLTPDGSILAFFGYPNGVPNACQSALRAAYNIRLQQEIDDVLLRFALHHGPMLVWPAADCPDALGGMSAIVMQLAASGSPGEILATSAFVERVNTLALAPLERSPEFFPQEGLEAYRIGNLANAPARREPALVGREVERRQLGTLWRGAQRGGLRAVVLGGPPGSGKSRLAKWLVGTLAEPGQAVVLQCWQNQSEAPFFPISETIKTQCGIHAGDNSEIRQLKMDRWLDRRHPDLADEHRRMAAWLVGLPLDDAASSPASRRRCLHQALRAMLANLAGNGPVLVVLEDIHWADPSTLQFIGDLLGSAAELPWLLLITARAPLADTWQPQLPRLRLDPLSAEQSRELVKSLQHAPLDETHIADIVARADGNPLFIEALVQAQAGTNPAEQPLASLEESILAPIAGDELLCRIAWGAATLGEEFDAGLLRALFPEIGEARFADALLALERHGLVKPGVGGRRRFHHALVCDTLYNSLSFHERRQMHGRIQAATPAFMPGLADEQPHWLARHAALAGDPASAVGLYEQAARRDLSMAAHTEAARHFHSARELLERMPTSPANDRRIARLLLGEGNATVALRGYGAAETRALFSQVLERSNPNSEREEVFLAEYGLWLGGSSHDGYLHALRYVDILQRTAEATGSALHRLQTAYAYGNTYLWLGELEQARRHLDDAVALYDSQRPPELLDHFHEDTGVTSLSLLAWTLWLQGNAVAAAAAQARAVELAEALGHPYSLAFAVACAARLELLRGEIEPVRHFADRLMALADRHDFAIWQGVGAVMQAWVRCCAGDAGGIPLAVRSLELIGQALPSLEVTILSMYVDGLYRLGDLAACTAHLDTALARCAYWHDHYVEAELLRLRGLCAAAAGDAVAAREWRDAAHALASRQGARVILERIEIG